MLLRVNIRKIKGLIWLAGAAAFVFAGYTFYDIFTRKQQKHYEHRSRDYFITDVLRANVQEQVGSTKKPFYPQDEYEKVWDTLIDGSVRKVEPAPGEGGPPPEPVEQPVPEIDTIVDVSLVLWAPQPEMRFVALNYKAGGAPAPAPAAAGALAPSGSKESRLHLSEGDPLKAPYDVAPYNGKVLKIDMQEVTFQWGKGEATVTPGLGASGSDKPLRLFEVPMESDVVADVAVSDKTKQVKPGHWIMGTSDLDRMRENPQGFLEEQVSAHTVTPASGGRSWLEITQDPPPGSLAEQFGVKKGTKIISVNGIPMSTISGAINWAKQHPNEPQYVVIYEQPGTGKQETLTLHQK
jgi:hypothetical protein